MCGNQGFAVRHIGAFILSVWTTNAALCVPETFVGLVGQASSATSKIHIKALRRSGDARRNFAVVELVATAPCLVVDFLFTTSAANPAARWIKGAIKFRHRACGLHRIQHQHRCPRRCTSDCLTRTQRAEAVAASELSVSPTFSVSGRPPRHSAPRLAVCDADDDVTPAGRRLLTSTSQESLLSGSAARYQMNWTVQAGQQPRRRQMKGSLRMACG